MFSPPLLIYRVSRKVHLYGFTRLAKLLSWWNRYLFATWLPASCETGKGVTIGYWGLGIVIHSRARIGPDCLISQNVTIGRKEGEYDVPTIGARVHIGAGACIIGPISIGDDTTIGANAVVAQSLPPRCVAAGVPARILRMTDAPRSPNINKGEEAPTGTSKLAPHPDQSPSSSTLSTPQQEKTIEDQSIPLRTGTVDT